MGKQRDRFVNTEGGNVLHTALNVMPLSNFRVFIVVTALTKHSQAAGVALCGLRFTRSSNYLRTGT